MQKNISNYRLTILCASVLSAAVSVPVFAAGNAGMPGNIPAVPVSVVKDGAAVAREKIVEAEAKSMINYSGKIEMKPGKNVMIPVAVNHPNRIVTPFRKPQVISTTLTGGSGQNCGEVCVRGNIVYISTDKTYPVTAFISETGNDGIALSVTMIPQRIPPREVELTVPADIAEKIAVGGAVMGDSSLAEAWETSQPYVDTIREAFRLIAKGEVPQGYSMRNVNPRRDTIPYCNQQGLDIDFRKGQFIKGHNLNILVGTIENISDKPIEFREQTCGAWNVAAAASWPLKVLRPGQKTEVYVAMKVKEETPPANVRKPLINREYN